MNTTNLVLYQFTLEGPTLTGYLQNHTSDVSKLYASLANLFIVVFVEKQGDQVVPLGGFVVKTNLSNDTASFQTDILNTAKALQTTATLVARTKTFQTIKAKESDTSLPSEADFERMAIHVHTRVGVAGSA